MIHLETFVPKDEIIPTELRLKAYDLPNHPDMQIIYERVPGEFAYKFTFYHTFFYQENTLKVCGDILDQIIRTLCSQSYDHGAAWREISRDFMPESDESYSVYKVKFYVRDAG